MATRGSSMCARGFADGDDGARVRGLVLVQLGDRRRVVRWARLVFLRTAAAGAGEHQPDHSHTDHRERKPDSELLHQLPPDSSPRVRSGPPRSAAGGGDDGGCDGVDGPAPLPVAPCAGPGADDGVGPAGAGVRAPAPPPAAGPLPAAPLPVVPFPVVVGAVPDVLEDGLPAPGVIVTESRCRSRTISGLRYVDRSVRPLSPHGEVARQRQFEARQQVAEPQRPLLRPYNNGEPFPRPADSPVGQARLAANASARRNCVVVMVRPTDSD